MKFTSTLIASASGSAAGNVWSHNAGGQYIRRRAVPTDPQTGYQTNVRNAMATAAERWSLVLTEAQREGWRTWAAGITVVNTLGQAIKLSGFAHFVRINSLVYQTLGATTTGGGFLGADAPPSGSVIGPTAAVLSATLDTVAGPPVQWNLDVQIDPLPTGGVVGIWLSPPVGVGRNFWKGPYILTDTQVAAAYAPTNLNAAGSPEYKNRFGLPVAGQKFWGYLRCQAADGRIGPRINFGPIIAT